MDPNEALKQIEVLMSYCPKQEQYKQLDIYCWALQHWLSKEGFEPNWQKYPQATAFYNGWYVRDLAQKNSESD